MVFFSIAGLDTIDSIDGVSILNLFILQDPFPSMPRKSRARPTKVPPRQPKSVVPPMEGWEVTPEFAREAMLRYARSGVAGRQLFVQAFWERAKPFFRDRASFEQWVHANLGSKTPGELSALRSASSHAISSPSGSASSKSAGKAGFSKGRGPVPTGPESWSNAYPWKIVSPLARLERMDARRLLENSFTPAERASLSSFGQSHLSPIEFSILSDFLRGTPISTIARQLQDAHPKLSISPQTAANGISNILISLTRVVGIFSHPEMQGVSSGPQRPATKKYVDRRPLGIFFGALDVRDQQGRLGKPKE